MLGFGSPGLSPRVARSVGTVLLLASMAAVLASCNSVTVNSNNDGGIDVLDKVRSLDTLPRYPQQTGSLATNTGSPAQPAVYPGVEVNDISEARPQPVASGSGFEF